MKILCFGDPEGQLQKKRKKLKHIIKNHKADYIVFLGDYYSTPLPYYNKLLKYKKTLSLYDLFPEANLIKGIEEENKYIFIYGNKDINSKILKLTKEKNKKKLKNWFFVQRKKGEIKPLNFYVINGNYAIEISQIPNKLIKELENLKKKYNVKSLLWKSTKEKKSKIINILEEKFGKKYIDLLFGPYLTRFKTLSRVKTDAKILLSHTPPNLKNSELIFGNYPDFAIYKEDPLSKSGIIPTYEDDPAAKKSHVGEEKILKFILKNKFEIVLCGHIHEGSGIALIKETNTYVINPGSIGAFQNKKQIIPYCFIDQKNKETKIFIKSWLGEREIIIKNKRTT